MEFRHPGADEDVSRPRSSPFYASIHRPMGVEQALEWSTFSDWAMLPQVFYFQGVPDLFLQLMDAEALHDASAKMRAFNDEEPGTGEEDLISAVQNWRRVAQRLAFAVTGETGDDACKVDVMVLGPGSLPIGWALELGNVAQFNGIILGEDLPEIPAGASEDVPGDLERRAFESEDSEQQERVRSKDTDEPQFEEDGVNVTTQNEQAQPSADAAATQGGHEEPSADAAAAQGDQPPPRATKRSHQQMQMQPRLTKQIHQLQLHHTAMARSLGLHRQTPHPPSPPRLQRRTGLLVLGMSRDPGARQQKEQPFQVPTKPLLICRPSGQCEEGPPLALHSRVADKQRRVAWLEI
ncbi:unnamed protein product [Effrenium voratum]|nr:unnamed protein product [Effrenium voratum]